MTRENQNKTICFERWIHGHGIGNRTGFQKKFSKKTHLIRLDNSFTICGKDTEYQMLKPRRKTSQLCKRCLYILNTYKFKYQRV